MQLTLNNRLCTPSAFPRLTALDFETTGTVRGFSSLPWQVGAVTMDARRLNMDGPQMDTLLCVPEDHPFSPHAPGTYRTRRPDIAAAPAAMEVWPDLHALLSDSIPVAHNISTERTLLRRLAPMTEYPAWIDTLPLARHTWPGLPSYALDRLIPTLGLQSRLEALVPGREAHDAYYDAVACALLLETMLALPGWEHVTPEDILRR